MQTTTIIQWLVWEILMLFKFKGFSGFLHPLWKGCGDSKNTLGLYIYVCGEISGLS